MNNELIDKPLRNYMVLIELNLKNINYILDENNIGMKNYEWHVNLTMKLKKLNKILI